MYRLDKIVFPSITLVITTLGSAEVTGAVEELDELDVELDVMCELGVDELLLCVE